MDGGGHGPGPLSGREIRALADAFSDAVSARHVLEDAGIRVGRHPPWLGAAEQFWADPSGVAVDPTGTLYIADSDNLRVRRVAIDG